jgi:hypothetical protein
MGSLLDKRWYVNRAMHDNVPGLVHLDRIFLVLVVVLIAPTTRRRRKQRQSTVRNMLETRCRETIVPGERLKWVRC